MTVQDEINKLERQLSETMMLGYMTAKRGSGEWVYPPRKILRHRCLGGSGQ